MASTPEIISETKNPTADHATRVQLIWGQIAAYNVAKWKFFVAIDVTKRVAEMPKCFCSVIMNQMLKNFRLGNSDRTQLNSNIPDADRD